MSALADLSAPIAALPQPVPYPPDSAIEPPPSFTPEEVAQVADSPEFAALPADARARAADHMLGTAHASIKGPWTPDKQAAWLDFANTVQGKAGQTTGEWFADLPAKTLGGVTQLVAGLPGQVADAALAVGDMVSEKSDGKLGEAYGRELLGQGAKLIGQANWLSDRREQMNALKAHVDAGGVPLHDPPALAQWTKEWSARVPEINTQEGAQALAMYLRTGAPSAMAQLSQLAKRSDLTRWGERQMQTAQNSGAVQDLPSYLQEQFPMAADPLNIALMAAPVLRGAKVAAAGTLGERALQVVKSAGEGAMIGAAMHGRDNADAGLADTLKAAGEMAAMTGSMSAVGALRPLDRPAMPANELGRDAEGMVPVDAVPVQAEATVKESLTPAPGLEGASDADFAALDSHFATAMPEAIVPDAAPPPIEVPGRDGPVAGGVDPVGVESRPAATSAGGSEQAPEMMAPLLEGVPVDETPFASVNDAPEAPRGSPPLEGAARNEPVMPADKTGVPPADVAGSTTAAGASVRDGLTELSQTDRMGGMASNDEAAQSSTAISGGLAEVVSRYNEAVKSYDYDSAQQIVDSTLAKRGYDFVGYSAHPIGKNFDKRITFFSDKIGDAESYAHENPDLEVKRVAVALGRMFEFDAQGERWDKLEFNDTTSTTDEIARWAKDNGYDSVKILNVRDPGPAPRNREPSTIVAAWSGNVADASYGKKASDLAARLQQTPTVSSEGSSPVGQPALRQGVDQSLSKTDTSSPAVNAFNTPAPSSGAKGITNTRIQRSLDSGFLNAGAFADVVTHAAEAIGRGVKDFATWAAEMVKTFGEKIRQYLRSAWEQATQHLPTDRAKNTRMGGPQGTEPVRVRESGAIDVRGLFGTAKDQAKDFADKLKMPRFTDLARSVNGWVGRMQGSSVSIRNMMHEIERRVPSAVKREGITNWIQAGGDDVLLAAREATSKGKLRDGYKAARALTPDEVKLAQKVSSYYEAALAKAQSHGLVKDGIDNYVNQVWKKPVLPGKAKALGEFQGQLSRTFKFGKQRKLESFHEGEQLGFVPETKDVSKLLGLYLNEMNKTIATREMIGNLTTGAASDGRPLAVPTGGVIPTEGSPGEVTLVLPGAKGSVTFNGEKVETRDYLPIGNPALAKWKFSAADTDGKPVMVLGNLAVHPEAHKVIENALSQSSIRKWMNEQADSAVGHLARMAVRSVDALQSQIKSSMMSLSPFHVVQEGTHAVGHKVNPFTNIPSVDPTNPAHMDMMNHGLMLAGDRVSMAQFMDGFTPAGSWIEKIPGIGKWQKAMSEWTFEHYIPGLKIKTYDAILRRNSTRFEPEMKAGKVSLDDVKYLSAKQTNAAYGHLNYKDMGRNPTFQHLLRLVLLAPDFLEARSKFTGQAMQGITHKVGREQALAMATLAVTFYVGARVMNGALNKGDTKNDLDHLFAVQVGNRNYTMRSVPEDIYRLVHDWRSFTAGRVSPLIGTGVLEGVFGVNRRGEKVTGTEAVGDALANAIPMSTRMIPGMRDLTSTQKHAPVSPWEQFLGAAGVQIGRHSPITEVQRQAHEFAKAMGSDERGSYPVSKYQQLRYALEDLDWDKAAAEIKTLKESGMRRDKLVEGFKGSLNHPYTGSRKMDEQFKATLKPEQRELLNLADQRRRDVWQRFIKVVNQ